MPKTRFKVRHQYDDEADAIARAESDAYTEGPSLTKQEHTADADINIVMARFGVKDGAALPYAPDPRYYGDFTDSADLRTSLERTSEALARFDALPAELRRRFDHDPVALHEFVSDPRNAEEAVTLGLLQKVTPPEPPAPTRVIVIPDPEAAPPKA